MPKMPAEQTHCQYVENGKSLTVPPVKSALPIVKSSPTAPEADRDMLSPLQTPPALELAETP